MINQKKLVSIFGIACMFLVLSWMTGCDGDSAIANISYIESHDTYRTTIDGIEYKLEYLLVRPDDSLPHPLVIMTHGRDGPHPQRFYNEATKYSFLCTALAEQGYAAMLLVRRGYGNSDGPDSELKDTPYESGLEAAKDIESAVRFMKTKSYVDPEKIVVMGHSQGGWAAIAFSTLKVDGVLGTVNISGGVNYTDIDSDSYSTRNSKWIADCGEYGMINLIPTLWIYSPNDQSIPGDISPQMFQSFKDNGGEGTFIMKPSYPNNGHWFLGEPDFYMSDLIKFYDSIGMTTPE